mmetsp:Transcript_42779/g.69364  ORF Transcript_42779/g.69364 Transcript_42779/m.69364 type:complete len:946 (-) Transcript_42779:320-3157(-)
MGATCQRPRLSCTTISKSVTSRCSGEFNFRSRKANLKVDLPLSDVDLDRLLEIVESFRRVDSNNDYVVNHAQFCRALGVSTSDNLMYNVFQVYDDGDSDAIDYRQFVIGLSSLVLTSFQEKTRFCFAVLDQFNRGWITLSDVALIGNGAPERMSEVMECAKEELGIVGASDTQAISQEQFVRLTHAIPVLAPTTSCITVRVTEYLRRIGRPHGVSCVASSPVSPSPPTSQSSFVLEVNSTCPSPVSTQQSTMPLLAPPALPLNSPQCLSACSPPTVPASARLFLTNRPGLARALRSFEYLLSGGRRLSIVQFRDDELEAVRSAIPYSSCYSTTSSLPSVPPQSAGSLPSSFSFEDASKLDKQPRSDSQRWLKFGRHNKTTRPMMIWLHDEEDSSSASAPTSTMTSPTSSFTLPRSTSASTSHATPTMTSPTSSILHRSTSASTAHSTDDQPPHSRARSNSVPEVDISRPTTICSPHIATPSTTRASVLGRRLTPASRREVLQSTSEDAMAPPPESLSTQSSTGSAPHLDALSTAYRTSAPRLPNDSLYLAARSCSVSSIMGDTNFSPGKLPSVRAISSRGDFRTEVRSPASIGTNVLIAYPPENDVVRPLPQRPVLSQQPSFLLLNPLPPAPIHRRHPSLQRLPSSPTVMIPPVPPISPHGTNIRRNSLPVAVPPFLSSPAGPFSPLPPRATSANLEQLCLPAVDVAPAPSEVELSPRLTQRPSDPAPVPELIRSISPLTPNRPSSPCVNEADCDEVHSPASSVKISARHHTHTEYPPRFLPSNSPCSSPVPTDEADEQACTVSGNLNVSFETELSDAQSPSAEGPWGSISEDDDVVEMEKFLIPKHMLLPKLPAMPDHKDTRAAFPLRTQKLVSVSPCDRYQIPVPLIPPQDHLTSSHHALSGDHYVEAEAESTWRRSKTAFSSTMELTGTTVKCLPRRLPPIA